MGDRISIAAWLRRMALAGLTLATTPLAAPLAAQAPQSPPEGPFLPERRVMIARDLDLPGGDLAQILDSSLPGCEAACLADDRCTAFTYNSRARACFPKADPGAAAAYSGALSGRVMAVAAAAEAQARTRAAELSFLRGADFAAALAQARDLGRLHPLSPGAGRDDLAQAAAQAQAAGDLPLAAEALGQALALADRADLWADYGALLLQMARGDSDSYRERRDWRGRGLAGLVNAYLRADDAALRARILFDMARGLDETDRGRAMIPALRLAQALAPRSAAADALQDALNRFGFRVLETEVIADSARPRFCVVFSEALAPGVDYQTYLRLPAGDLAVEPGSDRLCLAGVEHGARYEIGLRRGLPAASGEVIERDIALTGYVRDRSPSVAFPGRAYILPRSPGAALPVRSVNTETLDLVLSKVSDRNLARALIDRQFARPLESYEIEGFQRDLAQEIWRGQAQVAMQINQDMTARLPLDAAGPLAPGVYHLQAAVPGQDPWDHPPAGQWFIVSDLGLTSLGGQDGLTVYLRGLGDARPVAGATLSLVSRANIVLGQARSDDQGRVHFGPELALGRDTAAPALVTAETGDDFTFLPLTDPEFDLSDRGVAGREAAPPIDIFLTTDRGAYRAGETVHVTALARDPQGQAIEGLPLNLRLIRPDGVQHGQSLLAPGPAGGQVAALALPAAAPRGGWRLEVLADPERPPLRVQSFLVEDFLPERIDFTPALPEAPLRLGAPAQIALEARWLYGAPGADLAIEGDLRLGPSRSLPMAPGFVFGLADAEEARFYQGLGGDAVRTDAQGQALVALDWPADMPAQSGPLQAEIALRLSEASGRPVERRLQRPVLPDHALPGIRPQFRGPAPVDGPAGFDLIVLGPDGQPLADQALRWRINRVETDWQWYVLYGEWQYEPITSRIPVASGQLLSGADGLASLAEPLAPGRYELVVDLQGAANSPPNTPANAGGLGQASLAFSAGFVSAETANDSPDLLDLTLDKAAYAQGDTAWLRVRSEQGGQALVTVLADRVIDSRLVAIAPGEQRLALPVTADWGASAYVAVQLLRPHAEPGAEDGGDSAPEAAPSGQPLRSLGLAHAKIDPGARALQAQIEAPAEIRPRQTLPVVLRVAGVAPGETAYASLAAVDLGILNLTGFAPPDPQGHYFGQRRLGVAWRDAYGRLLDGRSGALGQVRSGGDGAGNRLQAPPPTEALMALFEGPIPIGPDGLAQLDLPLPAFNGTLRLMAVVWSPSGIGQAVADVTVRDPVVVQAALPRFLAPGDESRLLIELAHAAGPAGDLAIRLSAEGVAITTPPPAHLTLGAGARTSLSVPIQVARDAPDGLARLHLALTTPDGTELTRSLLLPIERNEPPLARKTRLSLAPGQAFTLDDAAFTGLVTGTGRATLAAGPIAELDTPALLAGLDRYPYGCSEQQVSRALPLLYLSDLARALGQGDQADLDARIRDTIAALLLNQAPNGAFGLWGPEAGDFWLDAYVTDFLGRARAAGHAVPQAAFANALDNLRNQINYAADFDQGGGEIAFALMVLAREGAAAIGDLRYYADVKAQGFDTAIGAAQLGAALALYGEQLRADRMFARAAELAQAAQDDPLLWRADYGSALRDRAAVLALATEAGSAVLPESLAGQLAGDIAERASLSPQEASWSVLAARALLAHPAPGLSLDGVPVTGPLVALRDGAAGGGAAGGGAHVVANAGPDPVSLTLTTTGIPDQPEPEGGNGWRISRSYYHLDGRPADLGALTQGDRLVVVLGITGLDGGAARLIVDDPLPAGFEIDNPHLMQAGTLAGFDWLQTDDAPPRMSEFRQNRFLAALDWRDRQDPVSLAYVVRAVSPGQFLHPAAAVEDMYRPDRRGRSASGQVRIAP